MLKKDEDFGSPDYFKGPQNEVKAFPETPVLLHQIESPSSLTMRQNLQISTTPFLALVHCSDFTYIDQLRARMAELVDALDSGSSARKGVEVQILFRAPSK